MRLLLHACCGPCATYPYKSLIDKGLEVTGFFYNPNIHPYTEYQKRLEAFKVFGEKVGLSVIIKDSYDLEEYLRNVAFRESERCHLCYWMRLSEAAKVAKHGRFDAFTTTLLVSPFQKHNLIRQIGDELAKAHGIDFYYQDFRDGFKEGVELSKEMGLYRQVYCGCIYSERDRFMRKGRGSE
jgi:predicted adenine nucleotide alpha hydrolase (AANH) superfamily ATPase